MDPEKEEVIARLTRIFDSFLQANFATSNNVYFEKLITHLSSKEHEYVLQAPFALEWVDKCLAVIEEDFSKVTPRVISFMFSLCGLLMRNEWNIWEIKERKIMTRVQSIVEKETHQFNPSMKLGSIRLFSAITRYSMGAMFLRNTKTWRILVDYCNKDHTLYVVREARQLLYELLYILCVKAKDEQTVLEIMNEIIKPLLDNVYEEREENIMINVDDSELQHKLSSTLDLVSYILQQTLDAEEKVNIAHLLETHHKFEILLWKLTELSHHQFQFVEKILTTLTSLNFAKLVYEQWNCGQIPAENFNFFGLTFFNLMKFCIARRDCLNFIKVAQVNYTLWKKLGRRAPKEIQIENERVCFENQVITCQLMPVLSIIRSKSFEEEEWFDKYIMTLFQISCEQTQRLCYHFRDEILGSNADRSNADLLCDVAYKAIYSMLSMESILHRDQAVIVFQAMIYVLREFVHNDQKHANDIDKSDENKYFWKDSHMIVQLPNVLYAIFIGLQKLVKRFNITWKESIETICLMNIVAVILESTNLSSRLAVQALKLIQLSVEHFLSPNMALLVDNLKGSGLVCLGPIIANRFHDPAWEVRDSTLELATSITTISKLKFPAFQKFLVDFKICPIVYDMAKNDQESYVRASALKCICQMVSLNGIWENDLSKLDLIEHLFSVLCNESEGIVRKEAVCTLSKIYDHRKIPSQYQDTLYSTLAYCVVSDLHWEVKVNALHFWELEIEKQLTNQGMIDGTFPTVTFSKENKKIVTLTEKEINLRIIKVFNELSQRGCLGVILKCLDEDCDLEVVKAAVCMVHRLLDKLKKYDYESIIDSMELPPQQHMDTSSPEDVKCEVPKATLNMDEVIDSIVSTQDINLLAAAYEQRMQINGGEDEMKPAIDKDFHKQFASVTAKEFIATIKGIDMNEMVYNRHQWFLGAESFVALLDDIMTAIKPDETYFADCY